MDVLIDNLTNGLSFGIGVFAYDLCFNLVFMFLLFFAVIYNDIYDCKLDKYGIKITKNMSEYNEQKVYKLKDKWLNTIQILFIILMPITVTLNATQYMTMGIHNNLLPITIVMICMIVIGSMYVTYRIMNIGTIKYCIPYQVIISFISIKMTTYIFVYLFVKLIHLF